MPTVTTIEIVADVLEAVRVNHPYIMRLAHEFTDKPLKRGQKAIAHISKMPVVKDHDDAKGYGHVDNAVDVKSLYEDIEIVMTEHKDVDLDVTYINSIVDNKVLYEEAINNGASSLARAIVLFILGKCTADNFSQFTIELADNADKDTLGKVRKEMNKKGAMTSGRIGIVNSDVFEALDSDPRIASGDFYGQKVGGESLGRLTNVSGCSEIFEYPGLPHNGEGLEGFICDKRALALMTGLPDDIVRVAASRNIPNIANFHPVSDPESGLTIMAIEWMQPGTFNLKISLTSVFGVSAGKEGGSDGAKRDYAGHRIVSIDPNA